MKRILSCFLLCVSVLVSVAQDNGAITIGTVDVVESKILNETRKVWVYVPGSAQTDIAGPKSYPVIYMLDGDSHFSAMVGLVQQFSRNALCPEMIVVGITNTDRTRDLTTSHMPNPIPMMGNAVAKTSGGSDTFLSFIEKELMPYIDSKYPTQPYKVFVGHSFGGLTVMNALVNHTHMFNAYVSIDPGMWWDNEKLLKQAEEVLKSKSFQGKSLFLSIANTLPQGMDEETGLNDTTLQTQFFRSIMRLDAAVKQNAHNGLRYKSKYYADDNHSTVPIISKHDGLRSIFDFYRFTLTAQDVSGFNAETLKRINAHYDMVSTLMGYPIAFPELMANALAYRFLGEGRLAESEMLFALNIKNYPNSFNVYDSMGEFYETTGNKKKAIELYQKALTLREYPSTRTRLEALLKD
ncbi:MAG: alpha/beta hydrolase-fold protein [Tenuifilaceae bacterium]|jgi:predicted alpha/beta superfamily hydrolase|nr:alpha/beta hydrolase-fold protein [Tenuifilaceae bacterium]